MPKQNGLEVYSLLTELARSAFAEPRYPSSIVTINAMIEGDLLIKDLGKICVGEAFDDPQPIVKEFSYEAIVNTSQKIIELLGFLPTDDKFPIIYCVVAGAAHRLLRCHWITQSEMDGEISHLHTVVQRMKEAPFNQSLIDLAASKMGIVPVDDSFVFSCQQSKKVEDFLTTINKPLDLSGFNQQSVNNAVDEIVAITSIQISDDARKLLSELVIASAEKLTEIKQCWEIGD